MSEQQQTYQFDEEFQQLIVATALKDPVFLINYGDVLLPGYFDFDYLSSIMRIAKEAAEKRKYVPAKVILVEEVKNFCAQFKVPESDREKTLSSLELLYSLDISDKEYIIDHIVKFGQRQALRIAILKIVGMLNHDSSFSDYAKAKELIDVATSVGLNMQDMGLSLYPNLLDIPSMAAISSSGLDKKIPTVFFPTLDKNTMGGPGRGEVWFVMGMSGAGKSAFLVNIGAAALKTGNAVFHYTIGDLDQIDLGIRYAARLTMSTTFEVVKGAESYMRKAEKLSKLDPKLNIKYYSSGSATMEHVRAHASRLMSVEGIRPSVVIIDYPEELRPSSDSSYESGGVYYSQMRSIADEFDCVVWGAAQPHRWKPQHDTDVLQGEDVADSYKKVMKADGIVTWNMTEEERLGNIGRLWVDKTRRHKSKYLIHCKTDLGRMLITETDDPPSKDEKYVDFIARKIQESIVGP